MDRLGYGVYTALIGTLTDTVMSGISSKTGGFSGGREVGTDTQSTQ
jgi:hypothetical protein